VLVPVAEASKAAERRQKIAHGVRSCE